MHWDHLKYGDIVDVVAPASHSPQERLDEGREWLTSLGLVPRISPGLINPDVFFAAPLEEQLTNLKEALYSESKAIWCLRGGYGSMRLIPHLIKLRPPKKPKLFIGFSDITALHLFFNQQWKWPTLHGRTISQMNIRHGDTADRKELKKVIFGELKAKTFKGLRPLNKSAEETREIKGKIIGGNLRILQSSLGTSWEVAPKGKILFIEDIAERGYSIDRMLEQMVQARLIHKGLAALVIGDFTGGEEKGGVSLIDEALRRFAQRVDYPVLKGLPCGHGVLKNHTLPLNTKCLLMTGARASLTCTY